MLDIPQLFRQVNIIIMRIFEAFYFVPEQFKLLCAILLNSVNVRAFINLFAVQENRNQQLPGSKIGKLFGFPCGVLVEDYQLLAVVDSFIVNAELVGNCLAALVVEKTVDLFEMRICNLADVLADLDFRDNRSVSSSIAASL